MDISDISATQLEALKAQGYDEADIDKLSKAEVENLLIVIPDDDETPAASGSDPHEQALQEQNNAPAEPAAGQAEPAEGQEPPPQPAPVKIDTPKEIKDQIEAVKAEEKEAFKRLMDGEIESEEYQNIRDRVEARVDELKELGAGQRRQAETLARQWQAAEAALMKTAKAEGLDYMGKPALLAAFNTHLRTLGADPKNERRDEKWFLEEAHRLTKADLGIVPTNRPRGVDIGELPPTLRSAPAAATGAVNTDEFAHMRNLEGLDLERAVAALTPAQRDRWLDS